MSSFPPFSGSAKRSLRVSFDDADVFFLTMIDGVCTFHLGPESGRLPPRSGERRTNGFGDDERNMFVSGSRSDMKWALAMFWLGVEGGVSCLILFCSATSVSPAKLH